MKDNQKNMKDDQKIKELVLQKMLAQQNDWLNGEKPQTQQFVDDITSRFEDKELGKSIAEFTLKTMHPRSFPDLCPDLCPDPQK
jgi:hypothetical protein